MAIIGNNSLVGLSSAALTNGNPHQAIADTNATPVFDYVAEADQEVYRLAFYFTYQAGDSVEVGVLDVTDYDWANNNIDGAPQVASGSVARTVGDAWNFFELQTPVALTQGRRYRVQFRPENATVRTMREGRGNGTMIRSNTASTSPLDAVFDQQDAIGDQMYPVYAETREVQITYTSTQSGDIDDANTWGGVGVPPSTERFTISAGHTVTVPAGYSGTHQGRLVGTSGNRARLVVEDGATLTLSGNLTPEDYCDIQVDGGGVLDLNGNDINGSSVNNGSVQLIFKGTAANRATIQSSVVGQGDITHSDNTSIRATIDIDYCDFVDCGFVRLGAGADPEDFSLKNTVIKGCDQPTIGGLHHGDADFIIEGLDIRDDRSTTGLIALFTREDGNQGVSGTGTKSISKITITGNTADTVRWDVHDIDVDNLVTDRIINERLTNERNSQLINSFIRPQNTAGVSCYNGTMQTMTGCYLFTDSDNPHSISSNVDTFTQGVFEATYENGFTDSGDHFIVDSARNQSVTYSLVIEQQSGVLLNALGSACTGTYEAVHNTLVGNYNSGYGALARTETGGTWAGTTNLYSNLVVDRSANAGSLGINIDSAGDDQITNMDYNNWYQIETPYQGVTSATKTAGVTAGYGANDTTLDPDFVDSSRDLAAWASAQTGTATAQAGIDHLLKMNGYDSASGTQVENGQTVSGVSDLVNWVRAGYAPKNKQLKDAGHDGITVGALEIFNGNSMRGKKPMKRVINQSIINPFRKGI